MKSVPIFFAFCCLHCIIITEALKRSFIGSRSRPNIVLRCPPVEDLLPCVCEHKVNEIHVRCENSEIGKVGATLEYMKRQELPVEELFLVANRIPSIPARFFGSLAVRKIFLIDNELVSISRNAFAGLESSLEHIYFRESILQELPFDTFDNLQQLRTIVLEGTSILNIPRLYFLPHLEFFKVDHSHVTEMNSEAFSKMVSMKKIQVSNSNIETLGESMLQGLLYLKEINFSKNNISWIHPGAFRNLEMVEELNLSGNKIEKAPMAVLPARELRALKILDLSRNQISQLHQGTFIDMTNLEEIDLSRNKIQRIETEAMFKLPNLKKVILSNNNIYHFEPNVFTDASSLEYLNLAGNNLSLTLDMRYLYRSLPNLLKLDLSNNHLKGGLDNTFGGHTKLQTLVLSFNYIDELSKNLFYSLPNLLELYLDHNLIKDDPENQAWGLPKLLMLDISHNDLKEVKPSILQGLPLLNDLKLSFNLIEKVSPVAFNNTPYLKFLNISYNKITQFLPNTFSSVHDLYQLDFSYNILKTLESNLLNGLTSLEFLHGSHNQITHMHGNVFKDTVKLRNIDLSENLLKSIPTDAMRKLTSLRVLKLKKNGINAIGRGAFDQLRIMENLDLSQNHIQSLDGSAFNQMNVIKELDLSSNYVQNLGSNTFSQMKLVEKLNLSNNFISEINSETFGNVKRLRILDLTNNSLTSLGNALQDMPSLQGLFLNHNYINKLFNSTLINLPSLSVLFFSNNGLQTFEIGTFYNLSSLMYLELRNNNLVELKSYSFSSMRNIKELKLSQNQISLIEDYAFMNLGSLQSIELQDNVITHIGDLAFDMLPTLKFLNLSKNGLQEVPEKALSRTITLDVLDLSWNYIMQIQDSSFRNLQWLTVLLLHHNDLCHLSPHAFKGPRSLRVLMLHNNQMKRLHLSALREPIQSLSLLDMSGNPFVCDCELVWLREYLETEGDRRVDRLQNVQNYFMGSAMLHGSTTGRGLLPDFPSPMHGEPVCAGPEEYAGKPITEVPPEAFLCNSLRSNEPKIEKCVARHIDSSMFSSGDDGLGLSPEVLNTLLKLSNLTEIAPGDFETPSYLDYKNPIFVSGLSKLQNLSIADPSVSSINTAELTRLATNINTQTNPPVTAVVSGLGGVSSDFVTGDTPTFYAGPSPEKNEHSINDPSSSSGGIFGKFKLPAILDSLGKFKLPNLGLNMDWGGLSFGRGEGKVPIARGPDSIKPPWVNRRPLDEYDSHRGGESVGKFNGVPSNEYLSRLNSSANPKFFQIFSEPLNLAKNPSNDPDSFAWPNPKNDEINRIVYERFSPHSSSKIATGPGPNAGTPFLPGLVTSKHDSPIRPLPSKGTIRPLPEPPRHWDRIRDGLSKDNVRTVAGNKASAIPSKQNHWDWSPPDVINPNSGVSGYPPTSSFRPMQTYDPNSPIVVVDGPNKLRKSFNSTSIDPLSNISNKVSTTTANILSVQDDLRPNVQYTEKEFPYLFRHTEETRPATTKGVGSVINVDLEEGAKHFQNNDKVLEDVNSFMSVGNPEIKVNSPLTKFQGETQNNESPTTKRPVTLTSGNYDNWTKSFNDDEVDVSTSMPEINIDVSFGSTETENNESFVPLSISFEGNQNQHILTDMVNQTIHILQDINATEDFSKQLETTERLPSNWFVSSSSSESPKLPQEQVDSTALSGSKWPSVALGDGVSIVHTNRNTYVPMAKVEAVYKGGVSLEGDKHISPSRSMGQYGGPFSNVEKIKSPSVLGVDLPPQYDETREPHNLATESVFPDDQKKKAGNIDWYYSNYNRKYDPESPLPVGGNSPPTQNLATQCHATSSLKIMVACILLFTAL